MDVLLEQTICTITDKENGIFVVEDGRGEEEGEEDLNAGVGVQVASYRCVIEL